jgi:predicted dienelactone hydrolase
MARILRARTAVTCVAALVAAGAAVHTQPAVGTPAARVVHAAPTTYAPITYEPITYEIEARTEVFVDPSRPTMRNGSYPGAPSRTLSTLVLTPVRTHPWERFPLVVFSHGFTANGPAYRALLEQFAAAGYVVAAPTFPLSSGGAPGGPNLGDYLNQPGDVSFVIDEMLRLHRDPASPLYGLLRPHRIGVAGHSLGAITTLGVAYNSCCQDPRIDAAVPMSGIQLPFGTGTYHEGPAVPLLLIHGTSDGTVPYAGSTQAFAAARAPKFLVSLLGGGHVPFFGAHGPVVVDSTIAFFDRYLKREPGSLLRLMIAAHVPGVSTILAGLPRYS